jgi:hypothetical protein
LAKHRINFTQYKKAPTLRQVVIIDFTTYRKERRYEPREVYRHGHSPGNDLGKTVFHLVGLDLGGEELLVR